MDLRIETSGREPIYRQLMRQIREGIAVGALDSEEKLPSVRELSRELVVNPNTIAKVYTELEREGLVCTRPGLGVFIARPRQEMTKKARRDRLVLSLDRFLTEAVHLGFAAPEVETLVHDRLGRFQWETPS
ncbi:MAG TPA: GntR family transcriptional regulator [Gemmataceae bacterium]|jgi:GntR family transcriptional regulator|nr:GntR family transcriptional regulator [Gemmataceae bacterium]